MKKQIRMYYYTFTGKYAGWETYKGEQESGLLLKSWFDGENIVKVNGKEFKNYKTLVSELERK